MLTSDLMLMGVGAPLGQSWSPVSGIPNRSMQQAASDGAIAAICMPQSNGYGLSVMRSTDYGASFSEVTIDALASGSNVRGLVYVGGQFVGLGYVFSNSSQQKLFRSTSALTWASGSPTFLRAPSGLALAGGVAYVLYAFGGVGVATAIGRVSGYSLITSSSGMPNGAQVYSLAASGSADGSTLLAGLWSSNGIYGTTLSGGAPQTWSQYATSAAVGLTNIIAMAYAYGQFFCAGDGQTALKVSTDNGATWSTRLTTAGPITKIADIPEAGGMFVVCRSGEIYRSTDFGFSWQPYNSNGSTGPVDITYVRGALIACGPSGNIVRSIY